VHTWSKLNFTLGELDYLFTIITVIEL